MAKATFNLPFGHQFSASLGNYSTYTRRDSKKIIFRRKGGPSADMVKNDPSFGRVQNQMSEFGGCSSAAKMLRDAMSSVTHLSDFNLHAKLTSKISSIRALDQNAAGTRSIIFSRGKEFLEGFNLSESITFDQVIATPVSFAIDRTTHTAVLQLPPLTPGKNFNNNAWTYPYFRFRINLGVIRDMVYLEKVGYKKLLLDPAEYTEILDTEWYRSNDKIIGQEVGLKLIDPLFDESCHLMLSIGIEFGTPSGSEVKPVKHAGCAKILAIA